jgi:hypothetical protein
VARQLDVSGCVELAWPPPEVAVAGLPGLLDYLRSALGGGGGMGRLRVRVVAPGAGLPARACGLSWRG